MPLTESQTEIWLSAQNGDQASCAFNEFVTLRLTGHLDYTILRTAMEKITARHDALRARFSATGETMTISPDTSFPCPITDAVQEEGSPNDIVNAYLRADASTPFDLIEGPPIRARLFKLSETSSRAGPHRPSYHLRRLVDQRCRHRTRGDLLKPARTAATRSRAGFVVQRIRACEVGELSRRRGRRCDLLGRPVRESSETDRLADRSAAAGDEDLRRSNGQPSHRCRALSSGEGSRRDTRLLALRDASRRF